MGSLKNLRSSMSPYVNTFFTQFSYFSLILILWSFFLALFFEENQVGISFFWIVLECLVVFVVKVDESFVLMPLLLYTQLCYMSTFEEESRNFNDLQLLFYSSSLSSFFLAFVDWRSTNCDLRGRVPCSSFAFVMYCTCFGFLAVTFLRIGSHVFLYSAVYGSVMFFSHQKLYNLLSKSEALIISSLLGYYATDLLLKYSNCDQMCFRIRGASSVEVFEYFFSGDILVVSFFVLEFSSWLKKLYRFFFSVKTNSGEQLSSSVMTLIYTISLLVGGVALSIIYHCCYRVSMVVALLALLQTSSLRLGVVVMWAGIIPASVLCVHFTGHGIKKIIRRKFFHLLAFITFIVPAFLIPTFLSFAISTCTALFIVLEMGRYCHVKGISHFSFFMSVHIDSRESVEGVVRSHIYLLYGLGVSIFLNYRLHCTVPNSVVNASANVLPGLVGLGLVDTGAAFGGRLFGKGHELSRFLSSPFFPPNLNSSISHKTWPGLIFGFVFALVVWTPFFHYYMDPSSTIMDYLKTCLIIVASGVLEAFSDGIDNLQLPLFTLAALYTVFGFFNR